jgi:hypothetical protein
VGWGVDFDAALYKNAHTCDLGCSHLVALMNFLLPEKKRASHI